VVAVVEQGGAAEEHERIRGERVELALGGVGPVLDALTIGGTLLGVLGAFLAVPTAACLAEGVAVARERGWLPAGPARSTPSIPPDREAAT
jgi:hypothetical protein